MEDLNREMVVADFQGTAPSCYLFCNGAAMYFDEAGNQIHDFQCYGMTALKRFVERYPVVPQAKITLRPKFPMMMRVETA